MSSRNAVITFIIILIVLGLLVFGGYYYINKNPTLTPAPAENIPIGLEPNASTTQSTIPTTPTQATGIKIGQTITWNGLSLRFVKIVEDSRCAKNVKCIQAGRVVAEVELTTHGKTQTAQVTNSTDGFSFGDYYITIVNVFPDKNSKTTLTDADYLITFSISQDVKG